MAHAMRKLLMLLAVGYLWKKYGSDVRATLAAPSSSPASGSSSMPRSSPSPSADLPYLNDVVEPVTASRQLEIQGR
jgi:hypothetical protein